MKEKRNKAILDSLALLAVMHYIVFRFLQNSMFPFVYTDPYKYAIIISLIIIGSIRLALLFYNKYQRNGNKRKRLVLEFSFIVILSIPFVYVGWIHDYKYLMFLPISALCLYDMNAEKVLRWFIWTVGILLAATIICSLAGVIDNIPHVRNGHVVGSYGTINTTDLASYFTFLTLFIWCILRDHRWLTSCCFAIITAVTCFLVYYYTNSKISVFCGMLTIIIIIWNTIEETFSWKGNLSRIRKSINGLSTFAFPTAFFITLFFVICYASQAGWAVDIDHIFTNRLQRTFDSYKFYGVHPFGTLIATLHGNGRTVINSWSTAGSAYLDVGYAMLLIKHGLILTAITLGSFVWIAFSALKGKNYRIALAMIVIAFHAFSEARFLDINYNILLAMPFCSFITRRQDGWDDTEEAKSLSGKGVKKNWTDALVASIILAVMGLIAPKAMSWLRTIFYLKGWTDGFKTGYALLIITALVMLLVFICKLIRTLLKKRSKHLIPCLTSALIVLVAGISVGNNSIQRGIAERKGQLVAEEEVINCIQEVAQNPVYAAEMSELYQRTIGGFDEHSFSTEEVYNTKGTIITDSSVEAIGSTYMGGKYTMISPWSGVYTFDPTVIEKLSELGYEWKSFYSGERECDLAYIAAINDLTSDTNGRLIIRGKKNSILDGVVN